MSTREFVGMTEHQRRHLHVLLSEKHNARGDARFPVLTAMTGREIRSTNELSEDETTDLIAALRKLPHHEGDVNDVGF